MSRRRWRRAARQSTGFPPLKKVRRIVVIQLKRYFLDVFAGLLCSLQLMDLGIPRPQLSFRAWRRRNVAAVPQGSAAMTHIVDFLQSQPPDVYRFVLTAIEPLWLDPKAHARVGEAIKQQYPGRFSDDEIGSLRARCSS
jgi:hypothetical protein